MLRFAGGTGLVRRRDWQGNPSHGNHLKSRDRSVDGPNRGARGRPTGRGHRMRRHNNGPTRRGDALTYGADVRRPFNPRCGVPGATLGLDHAIYRNMRTPRTLATTSTEAMTDPVPVSALN